MVSQDSTVDKLPTEGIRNKDQDGLGIRALGYVGVDTMDLLFFAQRFTVMLVAAEALGTRHCKYSRAFSGSDDVRKLAMVVSLGGS